MFTSTKENPWHRRLESYKAISDRPWHERLLIRSGLLRDDVSILLAEGKKLPGTVLSFSVGDSIPLAKHALTQPQQLPIKVQMPFQLNEPLLPQQTPGLTRFDHTKPALHLVCDHGVYLMSSGYPVQRDVASRQLRVAYAKGYDPNGDADWNNRLRRALGKKNLICPVPLAWLAYTSDKGLKHFELKITRRGLLPHSD